MRMRRPRSGAAAAPVRDRANKWPGLRALEPDELPGIRFRLATDAGERVRFVYFAAYKTALSMHVLAEPERHAAQHAWARRARRLRPSLRRRLQDVRVEPQLRRARAARPGGP
jgi:hypothetical protein